LLVVLVFPIRRVVGRDAAIGVELDVTLITNDHITTTSEKWSVGGVIANQFRGFNGDEFFFEVEGEDERAPRGVADPLIVWD
jgi:hypothetical protein